MMKIYKIALVVSACSVLGGWGLTANAQEESLAELQQKFAVANRYTSVEKVFVHTDKDSYLAGEVVWFKVYPVNGNNRSADDLNKVAYVEVMDRNQKPVLQAKLDMTARGGAGSFYLPLSMSSDNYTLRAYTNWMKNAGAASFFEKTIAVINTLKPAEARTSSDSIRVTAAFFPESGNLVEGLESRVGFKIADQYGRGVDASGIVVNSKGDTVARFKPLHAGLGSFQLSPGRDEQYKAIVTLSEGRSFVTSLPAVYPYGYVMNVTDNKDGRWKIRVRARNKASETGQRGENVFLLAYAQQELMAVQHGFINYETDLVLYIDKKSLNEGISYLTLFDKQRQPVCERLVFVQPEGGRNDHQVKADKKSYGKREPVQLTVPGANAQQPANYSVAVYQIDSSQNNSAAAIDAYLWLGADLRGRIESPGYYFSQEAGHEEALDNLLLTHGWRRFRWENIWSSSHPVAPKFIPEYRHHLVVAKVTTIADGKPAAGIDCFISFPAPPFGLMVAKTDDKGVVYFEVKNYYGPGEIIIQAGRGASNVYRVDVQTPFADEPATLPFPAIKLPRSQEQSYNARSIAMQAQNIYTGDSIRRFTLPNLQDTLPFYGKPEYVYRLDEYKRFTTMEEVLREYVTPIDVALRNGKLYLSLYDEVLKMVYTDESLILLDGVPLMDYDKIFSYDPLKVKRLDVVPRRFMFGGVNFKGVASFETYQARFDAFDLIPGLVAVDYEGLQLQREFYLPSYATDADRMARVPDYRSTLYWNPDILKSTGGSPDVKFYTSDLPGNYLVVMQGMDEDRRPVFSSEQISVK